MKPGKTEIDSNESVQSQTDASSVNPTPFVPPETKIEWQEETAPVLQQTASPRPIVVRAESGAAAAPAPIAPGKTVTGALDTPDAPHTLAGISTFDSVDTERDNRSLLYLSSAAGLMVAALLVLGLGIHVYNQRLEEGKSQAAQPLQAAQPQNAVVQKTDAKPVVAQAVVAQAGDAKPPAATSRPAAAKAKPVHLRHASAPHRSAAREPKVQVVNGVKHYSDIE